MTSPDGCIARDSVIIEILDKLTIPNAFSPNNDGMNDTWQIKGLSDYPAATIEVYDRWGREILTGNAMAAWDGTRNGKLLPMATYYYFISQNNGNKPVRGQISIIK